MQQKIKEYIKYLKSIKNISASTEDSYTRDLFRFDEYLQHQKICIHAINATLLNSYLLYLEKEKLSAATIARKTACIRGYCDYLYKMRIIEEDAAVRLKAPKVTAKDTREVTKSDASKLLKNFPANHPLESRSRIMIRLLLETDIYIEDLLMLKKENLNMTVGLITGRKDTTGKAISISNDLKNELLEYLDNKYPLLNKEDSGILFPNNRGQIMSRQGFWKIVREAAEKAGLEENINPRTLRSGTK